MTNGSGDLEADTERAWTGFRQRLADRLAEAGEGDVLLIEVETGVDEDDLLSAAPYVQFVAWGEGMLRAEVASDNYLDERYELSLDDELVLTDMGWSEPAYDEDGDAVPGEENFHLDAPQREADRVAVMAVRALREVYGCPHPAFLAAEGLERAPGAPAVPAPSYDEGEPELTYPDDHEHLQSLVDSALEVMFESPAQHDDDGDLPIRCGDSMAYVRVLADEPTVEVFADIVVGIRDRDRAALEVARLNLRSTHHQFVLRGDRMVMRASLLAWPLSPTQLRVVVGRFCGEVDDIAEEVAPAVGGRRFLEPAPDEEPVVDDVHPGLMTLLEILHTGRVGPATVAGLFDGDRKELVHQIHRIRAGHRSCGDHAEEVVLDHLRRGLRFLADQAASREERRGRRTRRSASSQLSLLPDEDVGQDSLGVGWGT